MKALPWRLPGKPDDRADEAAVEATGEQAVARPGPFVAWASRVVAVEPLLAPLCALVLLLAPNPLVWPAALIGLLPCVARLLVTGRPWRGTAFDLPLGLLALGAALGGYASLSREGATIRLTGLLAALLLFVALREHASGERARRRLVVGLLAGAVVATLLLLVLVGPFLLLERVPPLAGLVAALDPGGYRTWFVDQDWLLQRYRFRASGVGALADVGLALAVAALAGLRGRLPRLLTALAIPLFLLTLLVADNRGSMLAGALTLGLLATVWRRRLLAAVPVVAVVALLVVAFGPNDRGLSLKTLAQRFWFWENSVYLAREVPLTGVGLGLESVQLVYRGYFLPAYPPFSHAHNIYLQGLLEYGVFGLLGLLGLGLATLWVGWRAPASAGRWTIAGRLAGFGVAMAMLTTGLSEIVLHSTLGGVLAAMGLGLLAATVYDLTPDPSPARRGEHDATPSRFPLSRARRGGRGPHGRSDGRGLGGRGFLLAAACLLMVVVGLAVSGLGAAIAGRLLLNAGTADLNRATFSETIGRQERGTALNRALDSLRLAASLAPGDATVQRNLALALAANDETRPARTAADRAKAILASADGGAGKADLMQLGRAYAATSSWTEAIRAWQATEAAPQLIQLGNRLLRNRNFEQATGAFIATARVDPQSRGAYDGIARAARERKLTPDETIAELGPLLERGSPTELGARLQAARTLREAGRLQDAIQHLARAEEISAPPELSYEYGRLWLAAGRADRAVSLLIRSATDLPYEPDTAFWYARALLERGLPEEAVAVIRQGLSKVDPSGQFAPPAERLPETAAVRAVEIRRAERAPLLGVMGEALVRMGRADEALPVLDEAVAALPKDGWLAGVRASALAVQAGAPPSLLANSAFDRDGGWAIRTPERVDVAPWALNMFVNETPEIADGQVRFAPQDPSGRLLTQDVYGLAPDRRYRLSFRVRAEGLGDGAVVAFVTTAAHIMAPVRPDEAGWSVRTSSAADWTALTIETAPDADLSKIATVGLGFAAGTRPDAVLWCDEATLVEMRGPG